MNKKLHDVGESILLVSQFTLYANCKKGKRSSFMDAATPDLANQLYMNMETLLIEKGIRVETGSFGEYMEVSFTNDGPITILLDTDEWK